MSSRKELVFNMKEEYEKHRKNGVSAFEYALYLRSNIVAAAKSHGIVNNDGSFNYGKGPYDVIKDIRKMIDFIDEICPNFHEYNEWVLLQSERPNSY